MPLYPDIALTEIFSQAGVAMAQYEINDPVSGLGMGPTGSIAPGTGRGMGRYIAIKNAAAPNPAAVVVDVTGDNHRFHHVYTFNPATLGVIAMGFGAFDESAYAAFSKTKIHTIGQWPAVGVGTDAPVGAAQATMLFTMDAQDADVLKFGAPRFVNYFYPGLIVYYLGESATEVQGADFQYQGHPTQVGRYPWGIAFVSNVNGFLRSKSVKLTSAYPMTMHRYLNTGSNATVTFTLDFSPTTDQTGDGIKAFRYVAATGQTEAAVLNSVNIATRQVVVAPLTGSFADGDLISVPYESFDVQANS